MDWRPASRTMDEMTLLAFCAAMRLTSSGVTSRSLNSWYSPFSSGSPTGNELVDVNAARLAVDGHARIKLQIENALIAFRKRLLEALDEVELVDLALVGPKPAKLRSIQKLPQIFLS